MNKNLLPIVFVSILGLSAAVHAQQPINNDAVQQVFTKVLNAVINPAEEHILFDAVTVKHALSDLNLTKQNLKALYNALALLDKAVVLLPLAHQETVACADTLKKLFDDLSAHVITESELEVLVQKLFESPEYENVRNFYVLLESINTLIADMEEIIGMVDYFAQEIQAIIHQLDDQGLSKEQMVQVISNTVKILKPNITILQSVINDMIAAR